MTDDILEADQLREELQRIDTDLEAGNIAGYLDLERNLNLNAIAIGLGLQHIVYEPEKFPGVIYQHPDLNLTLVLFGSGIIATVDVRNRDMAISGFTDAVKQLREVGLYEGSPDIPNDVEFTDQLPTPNKSA